MPSVGIYIIIYAISNNNVLYIIYVVAVVVCITYIKDYLHSTVVVKMRLGNYYRYYLFLVIVRWAYYLIATVVLGTITDVILCII